MERWLQIREFPRYSISDQGRARHDESDRIMAVMKNKGGVALVFLSRDGRQYSRGLARLVAEHFLPHNTNEQFDTPLHLDGDRMNNAVKNLVWRPRWYAFKYQQQFEEYRPPFVDCPLIETTTQMVFANSWDATTFLGVLERDIAKSFHKYQGGGEIEPAWPTAYYFRRYDG